MKLLIDTHALIWWWSVSDRLPAQAKVWIADPENEVLVSAATAWEAATKVRNGKLPDFAFALPRFASLMAQHSFATLAVNQEHGLMAVSFEASHRDPFDRMLAAQAIVEGIPILSRDTALDAFGCERVWE